MAFTSRRDHVVAVDVLHNKVLEVKELADQLNAEIVSLNNKKIFAIGGISDSGAETAKVTLLT